MSHPEVSVIICTYNRAHLLPETIRSTVNQTISALEVLVIDDGSTDSTGETVANLATMDQRIRLIRLPRNAGPSAARNAGIAQARGKWIAILDADDICMPHRFERQIDFLKQNCLDICGSWFIEFGQGLARTVRWPYSEDAVAASMLFQNPICHPTMMAHREVFERYTYNVDYRLVEDYELLARAASNFRIANIPEALLRYRRHPTQATQAKLDTMEAITKNIRLQVLASQGIHTTSEEQRLHNIIRAPYPIRSVDDLLAIEEWLQKLLRLYDTSEAKRVIASQWIRACIRAAPLGMQMFRHFRSSSLVDLAGVRKGTLIDLFALAVMRLGYRSTLFSALRRFGLSA